MTPVKCRIKHEPENDSYGDCVRACVASLLDYPAEDVPHFHHDNPDAETANQRLWDYLDTQSLRPFWSMFDPSATLEQIMTIMKINNPGVYYMLFHKTTDGFDHVVICLDDKVDFNPAWFPTQIAGPSSGGGWGVMVICLK